MKRQKLTETNISSQASLSNTGMTFRVKKKKRCAVCVGTGIICYRVIGDKRIEIQCPHCFGTGLRAFQTAE